MEKETKHTLSQEDKSLLHEMSGAVCLIQSDRDIWKNGARWGILHERERLQTELSEMKKEREELRQAVEKLHIGLVARGNYDGSVTCKMVEELKTKYKF